MGANSNSPPPTHRDFEGDEDASLAPARTAGEALAGASFEEGDDLGPKGKWAALIRSVPEGQNYYWFTERGGGERLFDARSRYWSFLLKLHRARPAWTLLAQPGPSVGPFHWEGRRLGRREMCRLQTIPDDVRVVGSLASAQRQLGNAVPSLLGEVVGRAMREQVDRAHTPHGFWHPSPAVVA